MKITVVGDVLLDQDLEGVSTRRSPDGDVPVIDVSRRVQRAGGAGLVATMLARDGHDVVLVTALAEDEDAGTLRRQLHGIRTVAGRSRSATPVKTRVRANGAPFGRLDRGCEPPAAPIVTDEMIHAIDTADALVAADYGRGLLEHPRIRAALNRRGGTVPLVWDPHPRGTSPVPHTTLATPNLGEAATFIGTGHDPKDAPMLAERLRSRWGCEAVVVTLGDHGAVLHDGDITRFDVATALDADPCGAGDRFAASAAVELVSSGDVRGAVERGVAAAGRYLTRGGVAALHLRPLVPPAATSTSQIDRVREQGGTIVAAGGCFDLLHAGHVRLLGEARRLGDLLVVCVNADRSVRRLKGLGRPIMKQHERVQVLEALACVDAVVVFDEDTPEAVLTRLRPNVWVKGGDYEPADLPESAVLETWGGRVVILPRLPGHSTTALAAALANAG